MRRRGQFSRDKFHIKTEDDRLCYIAGIPYRFWNENWDLRPSDLIYPKGGVDEGNQIVTADVQTKTLEKLFKKETLSLPIRIGIGGDRYSDKAMALACRFAKLALKSGHKVHFIDPGAANWTH